MTPITATSHHVIILRTCLADSTASSNPAIFSSSPSVLAAPQARHIFEETLERVRRWYGLYIIGYVVMPEHVHLLLTEPERSTLAVALQMLKQNVAHQVPHPPETPFWQPRYYDFNVRSAEKRFEKLKYLHRNPVRRGLVEKPEYWEWSSYRQYSTGNDGVVEIESPMAAWRRRQTLLPLDASPTLSAKDADKSLP